MTKKTNIASAEKAALGCQRDCPFCGARCEESRPCEDEGDKSHRTRFHRPMAFKGTHEMKPLVERAKINQAGEVLDIIDPRTGQPRQMPEQPVGEPLGPAEMKKVLLRDYCTSKANIEDSRWPIPD